MMNAGVELMIIGMLIVFAFLALLVVMVNLMTWIVQRFFPEQPINIAPAISASTSHTDPGVIAAITAAVHQYRSKNK